MKIFTLAAVLWLGASQTVSFSNCCRGAFCSQKDGCPPCGSTSEAGRSCCDGEGEGIPASSHPDVACVHVEPSSEVLTEGALAMPEGAQPLIFPLLEILEAPAAIVAATQGTPGSDPPPRPHRNIRFFIQDSALLI